MAQTEPSDNYYRQTFGGTLIPEGQFDKWALRARMIVETATQERTVAAAYNTRYLFAICAVSEILYGAEAARLAAYDAISNTEGSSAGGRIASKSAGTESVSYTYASGALDAGASVFARSAESGIEQGKAVNAVLAQYLSNVPDENGVNMLFRGGW